MKLRARWRRYWHCLIQTFTWKDHRAVTAWRGGRVVYIGCACGRTYYDDVENRRDGIVLGKVGR